MTLHKGTLIGARYELQRELAHGVMATLWTAVDRNLRRSVVIKLLGESMAGSEIARVRFAQEAQVAASVQSPNVVNIHDYGVDADKAFIVFELLEGEDLRTILEREQRIAYPALADFLRQIVKGLTAIHAAGIVHRDVKPGNIVIARCNGECLVKVVDFGVSRSPDARALRMTKRGQIVGTPKYMSPEQIADPTSVDVRSDLWSLAVILYRALSGVCPFTGSTVNELLSDIRRGKWKPVSSMVPGMPLEVDAFFDRAFSRARAKRFESAEELGEAFLALGRKVADEATWPAAPPVDAEPLEEDSDAESARETELWASRAQAPSIPDQDPVPSPKPRLELQLEESSAPIAAPPASASPTEMSEAATQLRTESPPEPASPVSPPEADVEASIAPVIETTEARWSSAEKRRFRGRLFVGALIAALALLALLEANSGHSPQRTVPASPAGYGVVPTAEPSASASAGKGHP